MTARILGHVRARLVAGLLLVLPLLITLWLLRILFRIIDDNVTPWVLLLLGGERSALPGSVPARLVAPLVGMLLTVGSIYLLGLLAGNLAGRKLWSLVEAAILRVPLVKGVYGSARQLLDAFAVTTHRGPSKVVLVEYPRAGLYTVGFVTSDAEVRMGSGVPPSVAVFFPTAPNPTSGFVVLVPRQDLVPLDLTLDEGIKLVVSGGVVIPPRFATRADVNP